MQKIHIKTRKSGSIEYCCERFHSEKHMHCCFFYYRYGLPFLKRKKNNSLALYLLMHCFQERLQNNEMAKNDLKSLLVIGKIEFFDFNSLTSPFIHACLTNGQRHNLARDNARPFLNNNSFFLRRKL